MHISNACAGPERGGGGPSPEKSQKYKVSYLHWSGPPEKSQSYQASIPSWAIIDTPAKRSFNQANDGPLIVVFGPFLPSSIKR